MIAIASDHGGYALKEHIKAYLAAKGITCQDFGCETPDRCDYPVSVSYTHLTLTTTERV